MEVVRVACGLQAQELAAKGAHVDVEGALGWWALRQSLGEEVVVRKGFCVVPFLVGRLTSILTFFLLSFFDGFGLGLRGQPPVLCAAELLLLPPLPRMML